MLDCLKFNFLKHLYVHKCQTPCLFFKSIHYEHLHISCTDLFQSVSGIGKDITVRLAIMILRSRWRHSLDFFRISRFWIIILILQGGLRPTVLHHWILFEWICRDIKHTVWDYGNRNKHCLTGKLILKTLRIMHDLCLTDTIDKFKAKKCSQAKVVERWSQKYFFEAWLLLLQVQIWLRSWCAKLVIAQN